MIVVNRVTESDWPTWRSTRLRALQDSPGAFARTYEEESVYEDAIWIQRTRDAATGPAAAAFLATDSTNDESVGMVGMYSADSPPGECELVSMWTAPDVRGQGVGAALVRAAQDWSASVGHSTISLWVVRDNASAERLYARLGFVESGEVAPLPSDPCAEELRMRFDHATAIGHSSPATS